jgi:hypothetical protein
VAPDHLYFSTGRRRRTDQLLSRFFVEVSV